MESRRIFLSNIVLVGAAALAVDGLTAQNPIPRPPQNPGQPPDSDTPPIMPDPEKKMLEENDKDIKKKVDQLFELAKQLKAEVDKTDSTKVLSLNLMKKAEEIEKLAHDIKNRSKG